MDAPEANRALFLDPVMHELCDEVAGLDVLDVGSGEGRFCRQLSARGARTTGIEPCLPLLVAARERHPGGTYLDARAEDLPFPDQSFDLAVAYLTLIDIPDPDAAIREVHRTLRPGGSLVIANICSFATATHSGWALDQNGRRLHWALDDYMVSRPQRAFWSGIDVVNHHRPLSAYMRALLAAGLVLEVFDEPMPTPAAIAAHPPFADYGRKPFFMVMRWRRPV